MNKINSLEVQCKMWDKMTITSYLNDVRNYVLKFIPKSLFIVSLQNNFSVKKLNSYKHNFNGAKLKFYNTQLLDTNHISRS